MAGLITKGFFSATISSMPVPDKFLKPYDPSNTEARIYEMWEKSGYFDPDKLPERNKEGEPFSMVLPPPNLTGILHLGGALTLAIEDIMVRYARMKGRKTLWIPGTDHAAIATQAVVEKEIYKKEGKSRHDLGREELLKRIEKHVKETHDVMITQMRKIGASLDWSREAFTLDEKRNLAVRTAFKKMYDDGLIYRGFRVVNWDPKGQTTISDDEIVYETRKTKLYTFKYGKDTKTGEMIPISISTTRPETKLGDTAIAVHPDDARYKKYVGKEYDAVFAGEPIHLKVIADLAVEKDFGTGALGVTPAHSQIDWEMAQKHSLPLKQVINEYARMTAGFDANSAAKPEFMVKDKKVTEAREAVVVWLKSEGLLEKEEEIEHNIALAERTGGVVEPLPKLQWFVGVNKEFAGGGNTIGKALSKSVKKVDTLKGLMKEAVEKGIAGSEPIKIIPDRFEKVYFNWIENLRDWCISRQIWYGHRIPVYFDIDNLNNKNACVFIKNSILDTKFIPQEFGKIILDKKNSGEIQSTIIDCLRIESGTFLSFSSLSYLVKSNLFSIRDIESNIISADFSVADPIVSISRPDNKNYLQDPDTLDTWFSSGLWTFSTLGWPEKTDDLKRYHPTTILETGSDILFFWVARMILMSTYLLNEVPFKTVYLHGLVRDAKNRKISKSLGNNIDPLDMIAKYGADAVRMSLIVAVGPGNDSRVDEAKIKAYKLFANKLWNVARFIISAAEEGASQDTPSAALHDSAESPTGAAAGPRSPSLAPESPSNSPSSSAEIEHLTRLNDLIAEVSTEMDEYRFYIVAEKLYHYVWHEFADKILEESKPILAGDDRAAKDSRIAFLQHALGTILKLLHPFMPYVTEEIWQEIEGGKSMLMVETWPI